MPTPRCLLSLCPSGLMKPPPAAKVELGALGSLSCPTRHPSHGKGCPSFVIWNIFLSGKSLDILGDCLDWNPYDKNTYPFLSSPCFSAPDAFCLLLKIALSFRLPAGARTPLPLLTCPQQPLSFSDSYFIKAFLSYCKHLVLGTSR